MPVVCCVCPVFFELSETVVCTLAYRVGVCFCPFMICRTVLPPPLPPLLSQSCRCPLSGHVVLVLFCVVCVLSLCFMPGVTYSVKSLPPPPVPTFFIKRYDMYPEVSASVCFVFCRVQKSINFGLFGTRKKCVLCWPSLVFVACFVCVCVLFMAVLGAFRRG